MILLDTNVLSEAMSPRPEPQVMTWIDSQDPDELWTCTIVIAEVLSGLDLMPDGNRQTQLRLRAEHMFFALFADRIFGLDLEARSRKCELRQRELSAPSRRQPPAFTSRINA